jgi:hypothetical protein
LLQPRWLLAAFLLLSLCSFELRLDTGGDNVVYLLLGESLATGHGYTDVWRPTPTPHTQYPPGFPLLVCLVKLVFGAAAMVPVKLLVQLLGVATFAAALALYRRAAPGESGPGLLLLFSPLLLTFGSRILTEIPFLLLAVSVLALLLEPEDQRGVRAWLAVPLVLAALLVRTGGVALALAAALALARRRRWLHLAVLAGSAAALLLVWQVRSVDLGGSSYLQSLLARDPYVTEFGRVSVFEFLARVGRNSVRYAFTTLPDVVVPAGSVPVLREVLGAALTGLVALGLWLRLKRPTVLELYAVAAGLVLLAWPEVWSGDRFLLPLLPLVMLYLWTGLKKLAERVRRPMAAKIAVGLLIGTNLVFVGLGTPRRVNANLAWLRGDHAAGYEPDWRSYFAAVYWLACNSRPADVVLARKPEYVYLLARRRSACYPFTNDRAAVLASVQQADWVVFDNFRWTRTTQYFLNPVLQDHPELFQTAHVTAWPQFYVLKVLK